MVTDDFLYANVKKGLLEAPAALQEVYNNPGKRPIIEALLLDRDTPFDLYLSLFGFKVEDIQAYSDYFFCIPTNWPRLDMFVYIKSLSNVTDRQKMRQRLFLETFEQGWVHIDAHYNQQRCFSLQKSGLKMMKQIFHQLEIATGQAVTGNDISKMKAIVGLVKEGVKIEAEKVAREKEDGRGGAPVQLELEFVKKIQDSAAKNAGATPVQIDGMAVNQYGQVNTTVEQSTETEQLALDLKACGPLMGRAPDTK